MYTIELTTPRGKKIYFSMKLGFIEEISQADSYPQTEAASKMAEIKERLQDRWSRLSLWNAWQGCGREDIEFTVVPVNER